MSKKVKICPNCGSKNIEKDRTKWLNTLGLDNVHVCNECNFEGRFFLTIDEEKVDEAKEVISKEVDSEKLFEHTGKVDLNKWRLSFGFLFILMSLAPIFYSVDSGNILIGIITLLIGFILVRDELSKLSKK